MDQEIQEIQEIQDIQEGTTLSKADSKLLERFEREVRLCLAVFVLCL